MGYDGYNYNFDKISTKKLAILFGLALFGALMLIQALQGFPLLDLFRETVTQEVPVALKHEGTCVVETPDHPRSIPNCPYNVGDILTVTYKEGMEPIEKHELKERASGRS